LFSFERVSKDQKRE